MKNEHSVSKTFKYILSKIVFVLINLYLYFMDSLYGTVLLLVFPPIKISSQQILY